MIVLHGIWKPPENLHEQGSFVLWGEDSTVLPVKRRGRPPKVTTHRVHPFQAGEEDLRKAIGALYSESGSIINEKIISDDVLLLLPSNPRSPQASPDLLLDRYEDGAVEDLGLSQWKVNGLGIRTENAVLLLNSLSEERMEKNDTIIGTDLRFWIKVSKFAMELLSKQHYVPGMVFSGEETAFSRWQYVLNDKNDTTRFSMLVDSMPPVCRALVQNGISSTSESVLSEFINHSIDSCIRKWIKIPQIKSKKSIAGAWLQSLATGEQIKVHTSDIKNLYLSIQSWEAPIKDIEKSGFRTCFRLEPPQERDENDSTTWNLRYFLQASDDPSLLVPAEKVWMESRDTLQFLNRRFEHPQEKLLADLGKASRLYSPIEDSLHSARPDSMQLENRQAYTFLKEAVPLFTESGFGVLIPPWWNKGTTNAKLGLKLKVEPKRDAPTRTGKFGFGSIIEYNWQLALGDNTMSKEEFENLASLKEPLVSVRGQWVEVKKEELEAAIKFFRSRNSGEMRLEEALRFGLGHDDSGMNLPVSGFVASGWLSEVLERMSGKVGLQELPQPRGLAGELRPYQIKGFSWLSFLRLHGLGACLADDMGLGKTIQMLALLLADKEEGIDKPTLLICPTSVIGNWHRETNKFAPSLNVLVHHGIDRMKKKDFLSGIAGYDLVISTYTLAYRDEELFKEVEWNAVVLDEAQNIKNRFTKQFQAVRRFNSGYRVALTGTPVENRLSELWSIMEFLNPGYLGFAEGFRKRFALPIERYKDKNSGKLLKSIVSPFILRRLKTDPSVIKDLPDKIEMKVHCNFTKEQATLYEAVVKEMLRKIEGSDGIERKGLVLSALLRLKQVCNHPALFLGDGSALANRSGKLNRITEMLEEVIAEDDAALVFTQFVEMGNMLKMHFQTIFAEEVLFLHGGISQKQREQMIMRFSENNGPRIFILSLKAGGVGLNLTRANHVFHYDRWWNPAVENQATDRAFRIGQTRNVQVHKFLCDGTLEERIDEIIEDKKALAENIIGTGESWLTEMTTQQLQELFALRHTVIEDELYDSNDEK
ncbi:DEAD/DEAH box helicase [Methanolobus psychrotolerans]|uniref:DEAD/DEAH box helicase n=1 Tax=Methanolobus psychrotolerans TaxID=1874706 RepID=UPI000B919E63|nr:DEAD/DEAH box helicase [Methanolobus psychrotolerans]